MNRTTITIKDGEGNFITCFIGSELSLTSFNVGDYLSLDESSDILDPKIVEGPIVHIHHNFHINLSEIHYTIDIYIEAKNQKDKSS